MKKSVHLFMFMLLFTIVACEQTLEQEDIKLIETSLTGNWTVNAFIDNNFIFGPFTVTTQITSKNDSIFLKDNGEFWNFQTKALVTNSNNAFEAKLSINEISSLGAKIKVLNGNIISNDSITFDIQFEDDETPYEFTYKIKGHRK